MRGIRRKPRPDPVTPAKLHAGNVHTSACPSCGWVMFTRLLPQHLPTHDPEYVASLTEGRMLRQRIRARIRRTGSPVIRSFDERFWERVDASGDCWEWTGTIATSTGYGQVTHGRRHLSPHRYAYTSLVGAIPDGLQLDHLCRNRICCNPDHLEPVTTRENVLRGFSPAVIRRRRAVCLNGHELVGENVRDTGTKRFCRTCAKNRMRRHREKAAA